MTPVNRVGCEATALLPDRFEEMFNGLNELLGVAIE
jgi:hypothetical protein